jgi:hypothetical protein
MVVGNLTLFCEINYATCDAVTVAYAFNNDYESEWMSRAIKWIPAMISYTLCSLYSIITLTIDVALSIFTGLASLILFRQCGGLNFLADACVRSVFYDLQCLSVALVGTLVPQLAMLLRTGYIRLNS